MISETPAPGSSADWTGLFGSGGHRFQMRMSRGSVRDFFQTRDAGGAILAERRQLLEAEPFRHAAWLPEAAALFAEWIGVVSSAGIVMENHPAEEEPGQRLLRLGRTFESDLLFLQPQDGEFCLVGGCVCFPSSWSLEEKMGRPLDDIHSVVPGLNEQLAAPITQFLHRLAPGIAWCRENWGLSASPSLNQHPALRTPRLTADATLERTWLRVERQALVALPRTGGVCFGIRVESHPLTSVKADAGAGEGLLRALETMPPALAEYKGLSSARPRLMALLRA